MLYRLNIENFAIIERSSINFIRGFNVLTGETGAGKSILMDALGLLLGDRAQKSMIRQGEQSAYIQGIFSMDSRLEQMLTDRNIPLDETLTIERLIFFDRPGIVQVNGRSVTIHFLQKMAQRLARASYQGENQYLLSHEYQRRILDTLAGEDQKADRKLLQKKLLEIDEIQEQMKPLFMEPEQRAREEELLSYQIAELEELNFLPNEDEELEEKFRRLNHIREIQELLQSSVSLLYQEHGLLSQFDQVLSQVQKLTRFDESYQEIFDSLNSFSYDVREQASQLRHSYESIEEDPKTFLEIEQRLDAINRAKRKYAPTLEEMDLFLQQAKDKRNRLLELAGMEEKLTLKKQELTQECETIADRLHHRRHHAAIDFQEKLIHELIGLDIPGAVLDISIEQGPLTSFGRDIVTFHIQTNVGEGLKPLSEIASGGEISRIQLGIQSIMADYDDIDLLIFDEIDTGMSGKTAKVVAKKLEKMAQGHQLLVVSHLPQVIARGDEQYQIQKDYKDGRTHSIVRPLDSKERVESLAMIMSGEVTSHSLETAKQMIEEQ